MRPGQPLENRKCQQLTIAPGLFMSAHELRTSYYILKTEVWFIYNGVLVSGIQQSGFNYTHTHTVLSQIPSHYTLLQDTEYRFYVIQWVLVYLFYV